MSTDYKPKFGAALPPDQMIQKYHSTDPHEGVDVRCDDGCGQDWRIHRMTFDEWWEDFVAEHDDWKYATSEALRRAAFQAGAASRDAEVVSRDAEVVSLVAEVVSLTNQLENVTAHLVAAHSLLSSGGKKAAASDTIFKIMLQDYEKSFEAGRKALAKVRKPTFFEAGRQSVIEGCDDGTIDWRGENEV